ncbi:MAG: DUF3332 family protein [Ignavibacteriales bacterium]|nr:DUF3332 family protein [Ignavibacteriales bacterium]
MKNLFKNIVVALLVASMAIMSVGCYGSFSLTKKVYNWNGSMEGKWVQELVFLVLNIVPVYGVAAWIDVVILNSIEFWTGNKPMAATMTSDDGTTVAFNNENKTMTISYAGRSFTVAKENGTAVVKDAEGNILATMESDANGGMVMKDASGKVLSTYSQSEVNAMLASK